VSDSVAAVVLMLGSYLQQVPSLEELPLMPHNHISKKIF
jgi:hypothetical protein